MPQIDPKQIKQAGATASQVLTFDGAKWAPADAAGGGGAVDPSVIPSNQEWPAANKTADTLGISLLANEAMYIPFHLNAAATIKRIAVYVDISGGFSMDVGIYQLDGTRIVSSGSTVIVVAGNFIQILNIVDTALAAGRFYMAIATDGSPSNQFWAWVEEDEGGFLAPKSLLMGLKFETNAFPLPTTATFADPTITDTGLLIMSLLLEA